MRFLLARIVLTTFRTSLAAADANALEILQRLKGMDVEANPALRSAVVKVLEGTRGTPQFVEIVRDFRLSGQEAGLLEVASNLPGDSAATEAVRLLFEGGQGEALRNALSQRPPRQRSAVLQAIANSEDKHGLPLLLEVSTNSAASVGDRSVAVRGLARVEEGARELLRLGTEGALDENARATAGLALAQCRWPVLREGAARVFPPMRAVDGSELPSIDELSRRHGDARHGAEVFRSEPAVCIRCHRVGDEGVDFGPALSQIGGKLARAALYESILDPSAGISFGYEGWNLELKNGDEVFGILASETAEELVVKQQSGGEVHLRKTDVARREPQKLSVMPAGLGQLLSVRDLVDLVEYLVTLRAAAPGPPP